MNPSDKQFCGCRCIWYGLYLCRVHEYGGFGCALGRNICTALSKLSNRKSVSITYINKIFFNKVQNKLIDKQFISDYLALYLCRILACSKLLLSDLYIVDTTPIIKIDVVLKEMTNITPNE